MRKNKLLILLCSFLVAVGFWLYVVTYVSAGNDAPLNNVSVTLLNQEGLKSRGLMLSSIQDDTINLQLYGNRTDLWKLTRENVNITADLSSVMEAGTYDLRYSVAFPDGVDNVTVRNGDPARVTVTVVEYAESSVPVILNYTGEMAKGLLLDKEHAELDYTTISVSGPKEIVENIAAASITVDRTGLTETLDSSYRYTLVDKDGEPVDSAQITTDTAEVHLRLPVEHIKEIPLSVALTPGGGATLKDTTVKIEPESITVSGAENDLAKLDELVLDTIDLATVEENKTLIYDLKLPENLTNQSGVTTAEVKISFKGLAKRTFTLDTFRAVNLPEGLEATVITKQVEISLRGPTAVMSGLSAEDIVATADYQGQDAGSVTVPLTITVKNKPEVGVIGKYNISVTLAVRETEPDTES